MEGRLKLEGFKVKGSVKWRGSSIEGTIVIILLFLSYQ